jgi:hypothetical protein
MVKSPKTLGRISRARQGNMPLSLRKRRFSSLLESEGFSMLRVTRTNESSWQPGLCRDSWALVGRRTCRALVSCPRILEQIFGSLSRGKSGVEYNLARQANVSMPLSEGFSAECIYHRIKRSFCHPALLLSPQPSYLTEKPRLGEQFWGRDGVREHAGT